MTAAEPMPLPVDVTTWTEAGPPLPVELGRPPRTWTGALDWAAFLAGVWLYLTAAVVAGLAAVLVLLGLRRLAR